MYFWVRRLLGQKPPFFDRYGGQENAEKALDAIFRLKCLIDEKGSKSVLQQSKESGRTMTEIIGREE